MPDPEIARSLEKAIVAHGLWKARLARAVEGKGPRLDIATASDCRACEFGKWLEASVPLLGGHPEFGAIVEQHKGFHQEVGAILAMIHSGNVSQARESLAGDGTLRARSSRLVAALVRWRESA